MKLVFSLAVLLSACFVRADSAVGRTFVHPGIAESAEDIARARKMIAEKREPWYGCFQALESCWSANPEQSVREQPRRLTTGQCNGLFYRARHRSGRWTSLAPNPHPRPCFGGPGAPRECAYAHYAHIKRLPSDKFRYLQRAIEQENAANGGYEIWGAAPNWHYEWSGWGTLMKRL